MAAGQFAQLAAAAERLAGGARASLETVSPFPGDSLVLRAPGRQDVVVAAVWVANAGRLRFFTRPGTRQGLLHWDLYLGRPVSANDHVLAHTVEDAIKAIEAWWAVREPLKPEPLGPADLDRLRLIADARAEVRAKARLARERGGDVARELGVAIDPDLGGSAREAAARIDVERLLLNLPRDGGRSPSGTLIALERLTGSETRTSRDPWLTARVGRSETLRVEVQRLVGANLRHRWDMSPWLWVAQENRTEEEFWGIAGLPIELLGLNQDSGSLLRLRHAQEPGARAGASLLLLDADEIADALDSVGVGLSDRAREILDGVAGGPDAGFMDAWPRFARAVIRSTAPWRLSQLADGGRLETLPGQHHVRKASLVVARTQRGLALDVQDVGTNARIPEPLWRRPVDIDLRRFGFEASHRKQL